MITALRLGQHRRASLPKIDPVGLLLRLDLAWREGRRALDLTDTQLQDVGLTRDDLRSIGRDAARRGF